MFKNRTMQVKMVKTLEPTAADTQHALTTEQKIELFQKIAKTCAFYAASTIVLARLTEAYCTKITNSN